MEARAANRAHQTPQALLPQRGMRVTMATVAEDAQRRVPQSGEETGAGGTTLTLPLIPHLP